jgi:hypothetical protein
MTARVSARIHAALLALLKASDYAGELGRPVWDFAVEIQSLRCLGLSNSDLRWLKCKGYVEHAAEIPLQEEDRRVFCQTGNLTFDKRTCFVLTASGVAFARQTLGQSLAPIEANNDPTARLDQDQPGLPEWDKERQELRLGGVVVKQFKVPAPNQELILAAFQEEGWPPRIDDPLPPQSGQDSKRRLHDTIVTLNRNHKHALIHFLGDGTGQGVRWELSRPEHGRF